jgi:hypothetical protein
LNFLLDVYANDGVTLTGRRGAATPPVASHRRRKGGQGCGDAATTEKPGNMGLRRSRNPPKALDKLGWRNVRQRVWYEWAGHGP